MSRYDFDTYASVAKEFSFHRMSAGFAANSIKLCRAASGGKGVPYIWIDPPWYILVDHTCILASRTYPKIRTPGWHRTEREWLREAKCVRALVRGRYFLSVVRTYDGYAEFRFSCGLLVRASACVRTREAEWWYDDWYARGRGGWA